MKDTRRILPIILVVLVVLVVVLLLPGLLSTPSSTTLPPSFLPTQLAMTQPTTAPRGTATNISLSPGTPARLPVEQTTPTAPGLTDRPESAEPTLTPVPQTPTPWVTPWTRMPQVTPVVSAPSGEKDNVPMVKIPAGEFIMGTDTEFALSLRKRWEQIRSNFYIGNIFPEYFYEIPSMRVSLPEYQIDQVKVTNDRYRKCVAADACLSPDLTVNQKDDTAPVFVTWPDAEAYCRWVGKRLPTEAEWEKAARGTDGRTSVKSYRPIVPPTPVPQKVDLSKMVYVPAGDFIMGTDVITTPQYYEYLKENASPQHRVYLDAFYIDEYPVTNAEYAEFLNLLGQSRGACAGYDCAFTRFARTTDYPEIVEYPGAPTTFQALPGYERFLVRHVSWYGAQAYCTWRGTRLPTEAEWEKAARGTDERLYPWGDVWDDRFQPIGSTSAVGSDPLNVSPYGVADMLGTLESGCRIGTTRITTCALLIAIRLGQMHRLAAHLAL